MFKNYLCKNLLHQVAIPHKLVNTQSLLTSDLLLRSAFCKFFTSCSSSETFLAILMTFLNQNKTNKAKIFTTVTNDSYAQLFGPFLLYLLEIQTKALVRT